ncbi:hypothetical protein BDZ94DRAFT_1263854 [Collybia nuda]|uniref:Uncharacterized protein n=1 Tax=Collybia nuda TaxID=64659 RepID=A0A9P6CGL0_9AGAR|nr:hypothetical protein BDZ94DRAFT_1263854 [Collybia nuda]
MAEAFTHTVNTDQAAFLGFALEAIAYGTYVVLFFISIAVLIWKTPAQNASKPFLFAVTCFMFSLCTVHFSLNFNNVYNGLLVHPRPHISEETKLLAGADMLFSVTDFCSQLILIYRCYLVWGRTLWVVILPILINLATVACGLALIGLVLTINPTAPQAPEAIVPVGTAGFAMSLILNFIVSALIVGRIWHHSRQNKQFLESDHSLKRATAIIVESGLLFLTAQFVFVVLFAIKHPAQAILVPIATQIYGISPTLIIVRVGMGSSFEQTAAPNSSFRFYSIKPRSGASRTTATIDGLQKTCFPQCDNRKSFPTMTTIRDCIICIVFCL